MFGTLFILAAILLMLPQSRGWGVFVAGFVLFGTTVALLERRQYFYALPSILLLGSLPFALAAG